MRVETERQKNVSLAKKLESTQEDLMKTQIKYQKEIEKLEKENKELRKQILLKAGQKMAAKIIKKSLIDMYRSALADILIPGLNCNCLARCWTSCQDMTLPTTQLITCLGL